MSQVIAGLYEIQERIGAGGGGIVYLGHHLRLEKPVVLKADKRTLSTGTETLRREVDMLKGLSHTYIPQVYDFVQEDGVVYTVMDLIKGESLDKLLGRKELPTQPQVIKWACQLLEALSYLHSQPPHGILHGDIKPANIMLCPNDDICLIDFNIALALGEDGAVKVGFSRGYASPEHYGADYISSNRPAAIGIAQTEKDAGKIRADHLKPARIDEDSETTLVDTSEITQTDEDLEATLVGDSEITQTDGDPEATLVDASEITQTDGDPEATLVDDSEITQADEKPQKPLVNYLAKSQTGTGTGSTGTSGRKSGILLDVRSDIYSLGATLYHLLSGRKPAQDAREVVPLGADVCSPAVSAILQKAMAPDPDKRYQSAEEMLTAFLQLHRRDRRVIRHKSRIAVSVAVLGTMFLAGGACAFIGLKQLEQLQTALTLAEYSANALEKGDVSGAVEQALRAIPTGKSILEAPVSAQAQKALTDALGVYDLSDNFKAWDSLELPSAPFDIAVSPDSSRIAAMYAYETAVFDLESREKLVTLPAQNSALSDVLFADEKIMIYAGREGVTAYDLDAGVTMWTGEPATALTVSADGGVAAAVNRDEGYAVLYRISDGEKFSECSFGGLHMSVAANDIFADPEDDIFALNEDGSMLAVSFSNGGLMIFDLEHPEDDIIIYEESDYRHFEGGFCGQYFAFSAGKSGGSLFGLIDTEKAVYTAGYESRDKILLQTDESGIYLAEGNLLVSLDPGTLEEKELAYTESFSLTNFSVGKEYVLTATEDNYFSFYDSGAHRIFTQSSGENCDFTAMTGDYAIIGNRNEPALRLLKRESHRESRILSYDARYAHEEARISQNGRTAMLFSYESFRIYDMEGELLAHVDLPDAGYIYDQQFIREEEGSWLEVIWYDGTVRRYDAEDGSLILEETKDAPAKDLYEEFYTDNYRIESNLHDPPVAYELKTNRRAATLEADSYLAYVTQMGKYIITEYISASGERYGILLNERLEKLAYLPGLCDVLDDMFVFDDKSGNLRQCRLYSLQELTALGETYR